MVGAVSPLLTRETVTHAISGALAGVTAVSVFYPLETVRTRKQVDSESVKSKQPHSQVIVLGLIRSLKNIYGKEGLRGLYKGYSAVATTLFCGNFLYFYSYVYLQTVLATSHSKDAHPSLAAASGRNSIVDMLIAFLAGCVNVLATTPLWVANTRLKLQGVDDVVDVKDKKDVAGASDSRPSSTRLSRPRGRKYSGLVNAVVWIAKEEGVSALYSGTLPSLILVLNPSIQWTIYECLKLQCQRWSGQQQLAAIAYFLVSAVAKFCSTTLTYPLQVVQTRMRFAHSLDRPHSLPQMLRSMMSEEGSFKGLFKGLESKIVQTVLTAAFMIVVYEKTVNLVLTRWVSRR